MSESEELAHVIVTAIKGALAPRDAKLKALEARIETLEAVSSKALAARLADKMKMKAAQG